MKGIILAGGTGSRLYPLTRAISKHLLPIYNKPMIYYPLSVLMLAEIREILIITTKRDEPLYKELLGDGSHIGMSFQYSIQDEPKGIAEAFILGEKFIGNEPVALILGDNIFYGSNVRAILNKATSLTKGCMILGCPVQDPSNYGVIELNKEGKPISIEEKPIFPKSSYAIPGLYFFDTEVVKIAKEIQPSLRGELEITSVLNVYLKRETLTVIETGRGTAWLDTGTTDSLLQACNFVEAIQKRQGLNIACIEEIAYRLGYINQTQLYELAKPLLKTEYGGYLLSIAKSTKQEPILNI